MSRLCPIALLILAACSKTPPPAARPVDPPALARGDAFAADHDWAAAAEAYAEAVRDLARRVQAGQLLPEDVDETLVSEALNTAGMPDPDLLIRTAGEMRVSNFLLWQIAYAELHFTPVLWPDFNRHELFEALRVYQGRHRRFGAVADPGSPVAPTRPRTVPPTPSRAAPTRFRAGSPGGGA